MKKTIVTMLFLAVSVYMSAQLLTNLEPVSIQTETGEIFGTLKIAPSQKKANPVVLIIAGSGPTDRDGNLPTMNMRNNSLRMLSNQLVQKGISALSYDKRGIAASHNAGLDESELRFDDYVNDAKAWIDFLANDKRFSDIIIVGHSEGSLIGMIAAANNPKVSKYISVAGSGNSAADILKEQLENQLATQPTAKDMIFAYVDKLNKGELIEEAIPTSLYSLFRPSVQPYMISWFKYDPQVEIAKLTIPILLIQGSTDIQVSAKHVELLAKGNPKAKKVIIENMNHVLKDCDNTEPLLQQKTYTDPEMPLNKQVTENITRFIFE